MNRKELREKNEYTAKKNKIRNQIYSRISYIDGMIDKEVEKEIEQKHFMYVNTSLLVPANPKVRKMYEKLGFKAAKEYYYLYNIKEKEERK